ncbi:hypothetical protein EDB83DRAFT_2315882 [Lactarius deliciosus]|nr:hypothetical protein EDB83DRAFT_2315882 [Lactarius deliciosus]
MGTRATSTSLSRGIPASTRTREYESSTSGSSEISDEYSYSNNRQRWPRRYDAQQYKSSSESNGSARDLTASCGWPKAAESEVDIFKGVGEISEAMGWGLEDKDDTRRGNVQPGYEGLGSVV